MADGAYYVGRSELLKWINSTLQLNLARIEETCSGAVACQLIDALHPNCIAIQKVDFLARTEYAYINNYKVLQAAFNKLDIDKEVPVQSLIKGKPLDNMEFMQWLKAYFDSHSGSMDVDYDGPARRQMGKSGSNIGKVPARAQPPARQTISKNYSSNKRQSGHGKEQSAANNSHRGPTRDSAPQMDDSAMGLKRELQDTKQLLKERDDELTVVRQEKQDVDNQYMDALAEKDFYYSKLRNVELLCQIEDLRNEHPKLQEALNVIEQVLYAQDEEEGDSIASAFMERYAQ